MYQLSGLLASANTAGDLRMHAGKFYSANYNYIKEYDVRAQRSRILPFETDHNIARFAVCDSLLAIIDSRNFLQFYDWQFMLLNKTRLYQCDSVEFSQDGCFTVYVTGKRVTIVRNSDFRQVFALDLQFMAKRAMLSPNNDCLMSFNDYNIIVTPVVFYLSSKVCGMKQFKLLSYMLPMKSFDIDSLKAIKEVLCVYNDGKFNILDYADYLIEHTLADDQFYLINTEYLAGRFAAFDLIIVYADATLQRWHSGYSDDAAIQGYSWFLDSARDVSSDEICYNTSETVFKATASVYSQNQLLVGYSTGDYAIFNADFSISYVASLSAYPLTSVLLLDEFVAAASKFEMSVRVFNTFSNVIVFEDYAAVNLTTIALSPDNRYLACGYINGEILIFDVFRGVLQIRFYAHNSDVRAIQFLKTSKGLVSAGQDSVIAYDLKKQQIFRTFTTQYNGFETVAVDPSGEIVAASDSLFNVNLFDLRSGVVLGQCKYHEGPITWLQFSDTGNGELFSSSWDKTIRIMDCFAAGKPIETVQETSEVTGFYLINSKNIAVFLANGSIDVFNVETAQQMNRVSVKQHFATGIKQKNYKSTEATAFCVVGDVLVVGGYSKYLLTFKLTDDWILRLNQKIQYSINLDFANIDSDDVLEQKREFKYYISTDDRELTKLTQAVDLKTRRLLDPIVQIEGRKAEARVVQVQISSDQQQVFVGTSFGVVVLQNSAQETNFSTDFTCEMCESAFQEGRYCRSAMIASVLGEKHQALRGMLALARSDNIQAELYQISRQHAAPFEAILAELISQSYGEQLELLIGLAAAAMQHFRIALGNQAASLSLYSAVKVKTEDMRAAGVRGLQILKALQRYDTVETEAEAQRLDREIIEIKIGRRKEEMRRYRAKDEAI